MFLARLYLQWVGDVLLVLLVSSPKRTFVLYRSSKAKLRSGNIVGGR
jgi:hypothetical protein